MDEVRRKEPFSQQVPYEASSSSSPVPSQMQYEDLQILNGASPPLASSICGRPPISGPDTPIHSSTFSTKGKNIQTGPSPFRNCYSPRNSEVSESRPTKFRRKMLDLQLPADEYIDTDEVEQYGDIKLSYNTIPSQNRNRRLGSDLGKSKVLADLNEPLHVEETAVVPSVNLLGRAGGQRDFECRDLSDKFLSSSNDVLQNSQHGSLNGPLSNSPFENGQKSEAWFCYALESGNAELYVFILLLLLFFLFFFLWGFGGRRVIFSANCHLNLLLSQSNINEVLDASTKGYMNRRPLYLPKRSKSRLLNLQRS